MPIYCQTSAPAQGCGPLSKLPFTSTSWRGWRCYERSPLVRSSERPGRQADVGQLHCSALREEPGRNSLQTPLQVESGCSPVVCRLGRATWRQRLSRQIESGGRWAFTHSVTPNRVVSPPASVPTYTPPVSRHAVGSLRNSLQQPTTGLHFSLSGSTSSGDGRPLPGLGRSGSLRLPSLSPHPKGPPTSGALPVSADSECPPTLEPIVDLPSFARCVAVPRKLPLRQDLLLQFYSEARHPDLLGLNLHVFRLSGGYYAGESSVRQPWRESFTLEGPPLWKCTTPMGDIPTLVPLEQSQSVGTGTPPASGLFTCLSVEKKLAPSPLRDTGQRLLVYIDCRDDLIQVLIRICL